MERSLYMDIFAAQGCASSKGWLGKTNVFEVLDRINLLWVRGTKETVKFMLQSGAKIHLTISLQTRVS